ncbi:MAG TPA: BrnA antitoxin family protein [Burkholderiales bacterium]|nr:BrnA antitoxin family protein [Burkholderiales bacterium]
MPRSSSWCTPSATTTCMSPRYARPHPMKRAITLRPPKSTSARVVDRDNPPWSEDMLGPPVLRRGRGPQKAPTKVLATIRLDADVIAFVRSQGPGYQSRINEALRRIKRRGLTKRPHGHAQERRAAVAADVTPQQNSDVGRSSAVLISSLDEGS